MKEQQRVRREERDLKREEEKALRQKEREEKSQSQEPTQKKAKPSPKKAKPKPSATPKPPPAKPSIQVVIPGLANPAWLPASTSQPPQRAGKQLRTEDLERMRKQTEAELEGPRFIQET